MPNLKSFAAGVLIAALAAAPALSNDPGTGTPPPTAAAAASAHDAPLAGLDNCQTLEPGPYATEAALKRFQTVFGKSSLDWSQADYNAVAQLATRCHGAVLASGKSVNVNIWVRSLNNAMKAIGDLTLKIRLVNQNAERLRLDKSRTPTCPSLIGYTSDTFNWTDNSADLFGADLMSLPSSDLDQLIEWVNICRTVLGEYAKGMSSMSNRMVSKLVEALLDKMLLIVQRRKDYYSQTDRRPTDLVISRKGVLILPTFTGLATREMVDIYNRAAAASSSFTPERIGQLISMSEKIQLQNRSLFDNLYAKAVKMKVDEHIFRPKTQAAQ